MRFSFSGVNENADENEIPISAENECQSASSLMAWPDWPWPPQILRQCQY